MTGILLVHIRGNLQFLPNGKTKMCFFHFGAVSSAFYVWVNEELVGYSEDSKMPAEFNITKFLKKGENTLAVEVYRWSDGSYLEDQDFWRLSGIQRSVFLHASPKTCINDFFANGDLENNYNDGLLKLDIHLKGPAEVKMNLSWMHHFLMVPTRYILKQKI